MVGGSTSIVRLAALCGVALVATLASGTAHAADPAIPVAPAPVAPSPGLDVATAHRDATDALHAFVEALPAERRASIEGIYVAFDEGTWTPYTLAACDDDGDYVIVMSDPMFDLVGYVAHAAAVDALAGSDRVGDYATFLARDQRPTSRLLAPPVGTFAPAELAPPGTPELEAMLFERGVAWLVADELARTGRDLRCRAPTRTHEAGDDVWTPSERTRALGLASTFASVPATARADAEARALLSAVAPMPEDGVPRPEAILPAFFLRTGFAGALGAYLRLHPR